MPDIFFDELTPALNSPAPPQQPPMAQQPPFMVEPPGGMAPSAPNTLALGQQPPPGWEGWNAAEIELDMDLRVRLSKDEQERIGQEFANEVSNFFQNWGDRRESAQDWYDATAMMPDYPITAARGGYDAAADWLCRTRWPGTRLAAQSAAQSLVQQLLRQDPPVVAIPEQMEWTLDGMPVNLVEQSANAEKAMANILSKADWETRCRDLFDEITRVCPAAIHVGRRKETVWVMEPQAEIDEEALGDQLEVGLMGPDEAMRDAVETDAKGKPKAYKEWTEKVLRQGVEWRVIPYLEFIWLPGRARYESDCFAMGETITLRAMDLRKELDNPRSGFYKDTVRELLALPSDPTDPTLQEQYDRDGYSGEMPTEKDNPEYREWYGADLAVKGNLDGDKIEKWYWITIHRATGKLLRCCYLNERHGHCPYIPFNLLGSKLVGESVAELNAVLQSTADLVMGSMLDLLNIMVNSGGSMVAEEGSMPNWDQVRFVPGIIIPVQNINGFKPIPIPDNIHAIFAQGMEWLRYQMDLTQLLTATSNLSLGQETKGENTLGEVKIVHREDMAIRETNAMGVALQLAKAVKITAHLEAQYCTERTYSWTQKGSNGLEQQEIDPRLLAAPFKWTMAGLTASSSPAARIEKAMLVEQFVSGVPQLAQVEDIVWEVLAEGLQARGVQDWQQWIQKAKTQQQMFAEEQARAEEEAALAGEEQTAAGDESAAANAMLLTKALMPNGKAPKPGPPGKNGAPGQPPANPVGDAVMSLMGNGALGMPKNGAK